MSETITNAFTCTGPYAILIMLGIKRVENRSVMPVPSKGRCAVTCNKTFSAAEYGAFVAWASLHLAPEDFERLPAWGDVKDWPGKVIGCCDYEARAAASSRPSCHDGALGDRPLPACRNGALGDRPLPACRRGALGDRPLPWNEGYAYWWDLTNIVCFDRPVPCRGNVGMWQMPPALAAQVSAADALAACVGEKIATTAKALEVFRKAIPVVGGNEGFFVLPLDDSRCALSEPVLVSLGDPSTTVIQPGEVFAAALKVDAKAIILAHNHPSGNPTPSIQDRELTAALVALGDQLGVKVLDHLVIGGETNASVTIGAGGSAVSGQTESCTGNTASRRMSRSSSSR